MTKGGKRFCIIFINDKVYIDKYTRVYFEKARDAFTKI